MNPRWTLDGLTGEPVLVVTKDADEPERHERLPPDVAARLVRSWLLAPEARGALQDMVWTVRGGLCFSTPPSSDAEIAVEIDLVRAFDVGDLVLLRIADVEGTGGPKPKRPSTIPPIQPVKKTWIEVELLDEDGKPVATDLLLTLPDGTKKTLPIEGFVRIDNIDPGTCDIQFPKIDAREWKRSQGR
ncbi:MAG: hypothetical protein IPK82_35900 [Polyangiaceae bacterium]|nr:hypothetical protein [Polyangiaceae bacterium]